jgi:transcriptional regulator with XRE-family HTH domain
VTDSWQAQRETLGAFIRSQRQLANLSLRQLADLTSLSNPYLSQIERGLHEPSVRVLKAISDALNLSAETLLAQAGLVDAVAGQGAAAGPAAAGAGASDDERTEAAITANRRLSDDQKTALIAVYRSMVDRSGH